MLRLTCAALFLGLSTAAPCPAANMALKSQHASSNKAVEVRFKNTGPEDVSINWVDFEGVEKETGTLVGPGMTAPQGTYVGHSFRVRNFKELVLWEFTVPRGITFIEIPACDGMVATLFDENRDKEFEALTHPHDQPCEGPSALWSCVREITPEMQRARYGPSYGFRASEVRGGRTVGQVKDDGYVAHIPKIAVLTKGPGFLKMTMPDKLKDALLGFWDTHKQLAVAHTPIAGDYTNVHVIGMDLLNLDDHRKTKRVAMQEIQQVEQWWTNQKLRHTSTFGVRVYHRDAMLIHHVDRADTHLASVVLQIAQDIDPDTDEGWPLEVESDGRLYEVYLQPGEMVLYEGARLFHGRPMRFNGTSFANVFSHFAPLEWTGPGKGYRHKEPADTLYSPFWESPDAESAHDEL